MVHEGPYYPEWKSFALIPGVTCFSFNWRRSSTCAWCNQNSDMRIPISPYLISVTRCQVSRWHRTLWGTNLRHHLMMEAWLKGKQWCAQLEFTSKHKQDPWWGNELRNCDEHDGTWRSLELSSIQRRFPLKKVKRNLSIALHWHGNSRTSTWNYDNKPV